LDQGALEAQTESLSENSASISVTAVLPPPSFRIFWVYSFFQGLILCGTDMFMGDILDNAFYLSSREATPLRGNQAPTCIFLPHALACSLSQLIVGEVMDRATRAKSWQRLPVALLCFGTFALAFINLALVVIDTPTNAVLIGMARGLCHGIYEMLLVGGLIFPALGVPRNRIGEVLGYNQLAMIVGTGLGPLAFGLYEYIFGNLWGVLILTSSPAFALGGFLTWTLVKSS
jgi:MFS family permease